MSEQAIGTLRLSDKGPVQPAPVLVGAAQDVSLAVQGWPGVVSATHWNLFRLTEVDGVDFYVGGEELGHIHLDGSVHLATAPDQGAALTAEGRAQRFPYGEGWVQTRVRSPADVEATVALFRLNYDRLRDLTAHRA